MTKASCLNKVWVSPLPYDQRKDLGRMCHVTIDKTYQAANWLARPLREDMLIYAAKDVEYLHDIYEYFYPLIEDRESFKSCEIIENNLSLTLFTFSRCFVCS